MITKKSKTFLYDGIFYFVSIIFNLYIAFYLITQCFFTAVFQRKIPYKALIIASKRKNVCYFIFFIDIASKML